MHTYVYASTRRHTYVFVCVHKYTMLTLKHVCVYIYMFVYKFVCKVVCGNCGAHLGDYFDSPGYTSDADCYLTEGGTRRASRFCIDGVCLRLLLSPL